MGDAMSDMRKAERQWEDAQFLLDCYHGRNTYFSKEEAETIIKRRFDRTPESLEEAMK
jgi:hypothetical protein